MQSAALKAKYMLINMNLNQNVRINTNECDWTSTRQHDVSRIKLEREQDETGYATSIVQYKAGASFNYHSHPNGEEILVLDGTFSDQLGHYTKGTYIRNPPGSMHAPFSKRGCTLFVKLNHFPSGDTSRVTIDTSNTNWLAGQGNLQVMPLHTFEDQITALVKWPANECFQLHTHIGGEEIYVISGELIDEHDRYPAGTWLRNPHMSSHNPFVEQETIILVKVGHL
jgi:anti-sigma factor ChrR (cupin superfamily)